MLRSMKDLRGFAIGAIDGDIGTVTECYFDDASFTVRYVVVETGGWLADRKVLLSPIAFSAVDWEHKRIATGLNKAQVESSPNIDTQKPVSRQHETIYFGHYGFSPYWSGPYLWGTSPYPFPAPGPAPNAADLEREPRWDWEAVGHERPAPPEFGRGDGLPHPGRRRRHRARRRLPGGRPLVGDSIHGGGYRQLVGRREGAGGARLGRTGGLGPLEGARDPHALADRESPGYDPDRPVERAREKELYHRRGEPRSWSN